MMIWAVGVIMITFYLCLVCDGLAGYPEWTEILLE